MWYNKKMETIKELEKEISNIKDKLMSLGNMHPGSLTKQYNICGNPDCRCKDLHNPKKHGPYYQVSFVHNKKSTSRFVKKELVSETKTQLANYKKFKQLVEEWKIAATKLSQLKLMEISTLKEAKKD
jgi:hypothetical protein